MVARRTLTIPAEPNAENSDAIDFFGKDAAASLLLSGRVPFQFYSKKLPYQVSWSNGNILSITLFITQNVDLCDVRCLMYSYSASYIEENQVTVILNIARND